MTDAAAVLTKKIEDVEADLLAIDLAVFGPSSERHTTSQIVAEVHRLKDAADPRRSRMKQAIDAP